MIRIDKNTFLLSGSGLVMLDGERHHPAGFEIAVPADGGRTSGSILVAEWIAEKMLVAKARLLYVGPKQAITLHSVKATATPGEIVFEGSNSIFGSPNAY